MKVVLVRSRDIDPGATKLASSLSANGYSVTLLLWNRSRLRKTFSGASFSTVESGFPAPYDDVTTAFLLPMWWLAELSFLLKAGADVVHACDLDTLFPAIIAKQLKRAKLCYTIYDFYAANLPPRTPGFLRRLVAFVERTGVGFADVLFLPDESRHAQVEGARVKNVVYLYNSPPDHHDPSAAALTSGQTGIVLLYAGVLHASRGIRELIKAATELDGVRLVIAGTGPERRLVEDGSRRFPSRIHFVGQLPYEAVIHETERADALVAFYDPAWPNTLYASPNKLFEAMMSAKPILTNTECGASRIVEREDCGVVVPYGDVGRIKKAIASLRDRPDWRRKLGLNGREAYEREYSWAIMERRLLEAYARL